MSSKQSKMPAELRTHVDNLPPFVRIYCEYRAKGLKQPDSAERAGSKAKGRANLGKVGWQAEQAKGAKDYITWLQNQRAEASVIDSIELIQKIRDTYEDAMMNGKHKDALTALKLLGDMIGAFDAETRIGTSQNDKDKLIEASGDVNKVIKNKVGAFTEDNDEEDTKKRVEKLAEMAEALRGTTG